LRVITYGIINFGILELLAILVISANLLTFALYIIDKRKAKKGSWRISENVLIFFTLAFGAIGAFIAMRLVRHKTKHKKFKIAAILGVLIAVIPIIHITHALTLDRVIRFVEIEFQSENWPSELDGYRIAFMADMHIISHESMRNVTDELNSRNIDLLLLGGDFYMHTDHYRGTLYEIAQTITVDGIFGVEGNHDDYIQLFAAKETHAITPLDNSGLQIREGFYLAGVHDLWNRSPSVETAIRGSNVDDFVLLISHNPDVVMTQPMAGVDLVLSGHTHGGHITFFGIPLYLLRGSITDYGMKFAHGFTHSPDGTPIYTSSGVGYHNLIPRIIARPEVVIFTMFNET